MNGLSVVKSEYRHKGRGNEMNNQIEHPYAWLDLNALDSNIRFVNSTCKTKPVRIATKSIRCVDVLKYIERNLKNCAGFMTYTAAETLYLIENGFNHFLIGYPVMEKQSIKKLLWKAKEGTDVTFMVDCKEHLQLLQQLAEEIDVSVQVCIDLNVSADYSVLYFGTKRSPITSIEKLQSFLRLIKKYSHIQVVGTMAYDAQIAGVTDHFDNGIKSKLVQQLKKRSKQSVRSFRRHAVSLMKAEWALKFVNGGGTGSMAYSDEQSDVTEITVGSAFYAPALFDRYTSLQLQPAAGYACRVVRQFSEDTFVLHGGGYIASGATGKDKQPVFMEKNRFSFSSLEGAGEVQSPIIDKEKNLQVGDTVWLRHAKAGELCERFQTLHAFREGNYLGPFKTYRGDGQCFL